MMQVDTHEGRSKLLKILRKMRVPIDITPQDIGDYNIYGKITICNELKTAKDYINSVEDGRLNNELYQMSTVFDRSILLIYGDINSEIKKRKLNKEKYFQYLASCTIRQSGEGECGTISVLNFQRVYDVATFLKTLHKIATSTDITRTLTIKKKKMPIVGRKLATIESFPNVRKIRARRLKEEFKTIKNICNASRTELRQVDRIGKKLSNELYDFFNEE